MPDLLGDLGQVAKMAGSRLPHLEIGEAGPHGAQGLAAPAPWAQRLCRCESHNCPKTS